MTDKLAEFKRVLDRRLSLLSEEIRPAVTVVTDYMPHSGLGPVEAVLIGDKWAAFGQMWGEGCHGGPMEGVRVEEISPDPPRKGKHARDDESRVSDGPNPWSTCQILLQSIVGDWAYKVSREYHKHLFKDYR